MINRNAIQVVKGRGSDSSTSGVLSRFLLLCGFVTLTYMLSNREVDKKNAGHKATTNKTSTLNNRLTSMLSVVCCTSGCLKLHQNCVRHG